MIAAITVLVYGFIPQTGSADSFNELPFAHQLPERLPLLQVMSPIHFRAQVFPIKNVVAIAQVDDVVFRHWLEAGLSSWTEETNQEQISWPKDCGDVINEGLHGRPFASPGDKMVYRQLIDGRFIVNLKMNVTTRTLIVNAFATRSDR